MGYGEVMSQAKPPQLQNVMDLNHNLIRPTPMMHTHTCTHMHTRTHTHTHTHIQTRNMYTAYSFDTIKHVQVLPSTMSWQPVFPPLIIYRVMWAARSSITVAEENVLLHLLHQLCYFVIRPKKDHAM